MKAANQTPNVLAAEAPRAVRHVAPAPMRLSRPDLAATARGVGGSQGPAPKLDPRPPAQKVQEGSAPGPRGAGVACDYCRNPPVFTGAWDTVPGWPQLSSSTKPLCGVLRLQQSEEGFYHLLLPLH